MTAALLVSQAGAHLFLRAMGRSGVRALGGTGVQYVVWAAGSSGDLGRAEQVLKDRSAHVDTHSIHGMTAVEGHDPDGIVVMVCHPGPDQLPPDQLQIPARIYAW